jgi:zinc/manganese transport system substrate-binding protein
MLQQRAANPRVQDGQPGMFYAADHASLIDPRPAPLNPFAGDVHPEGNPHLHADPRRLAEVAEAFTEDIANLARV